MDSKVVKPLDKKTIKITLIGNLEAGKSKIAKRFVKDKFSDSYDMTMGVDFCIKTLPSSRQIQIWDTAGEARYLSLMHVYLPNSDAIGIIIDITLSEDKQVESMRKWIELAETQAPKAKLYFIGTKSDKANANVKAFNSAVKTVNADESNKRKTPDTYTDIPHFLCSAKTGNRVEQVFETILDNCNVPKEEGISVVENSDLSNSVDPFKDNTSRWERFKDTVSNHRGWIGGNAFLIGITAVALVALALFPPIAVVLFGVPLSGLALAGIAGGAAVLLWNAVCGM